MSDALLRQHKTVWERKPILKTLYSDWYREIVSWLKPGKTLEVGGGTGNLKEFAPGVLCTDVVRLPWLNALADAQALPFINRSFANIVLFDTLHHVENVRLFFDESLRVLQPGGRLVVMDPYISWMSWPIYHFLHPEPVEMAQQPLALRDPDPNRKPFDSNQAVATIVFERQRDQFLAMYPAYGMLLFRRLAFFAYPLSGGFDHRSLLPLWMVSPLLRFERSLRWLSRFCAFRILVVLEKSSLP